MTPTARSMKYLKDRNVPVCRVEQRLPIPGMFVTKDAFGFGDLLAIFPGSFGITLIQVTSTGNMNSREKKIRGILEHKKWLAKNGTILLHGWAKQGPRGQRKHWIMTEREITLNGGCADVEEEISGTETEIPSGDGEQKGRSNPRGGRTVRRRARRAHGIAGSGSRIEGLLVKLMHEHKMTMYSYHRLIVTLVPGEETVKLKSKKDKSEKED